MILRTLLFSLLVISTLFITTSSAEEVRVAVASNFHSTLKEIALHFEQATSHTVLMSAGSSGKFYAQITHGAPFDIFFSADVTRPQMLEKDGLIVTGSRFTYARGRLTLWSLDPTLLKEDGPTVLMNRRFKHLAIANPKTAPYGAAAQQTLAKLGLWNTLEKWIVQGENISQTFHFVFSENAQLGFVARAQVLDPKIKSIGSHWDIPEALHEPLRQQAVLLTHGQDNEAAISFLNYVKGSEARMIIERFGYGFE